MPLRCRANVFQECFDARLFDAGHHGKARLFAVDLADDYKLVTQELREIEEHLYSVFELGFAIQQLVLLEKTRSGALVCNSS